MVGLSRTVKLPWLNKAVEYATEVHTKDEFKEKMNQYLSFEIESPTVLRKTREILMHLWYYDENEFLTAIRPGAIALLKKYPEDAMAIHWCVMLLYFPVFQDLTKVIGRLSDFSDEISLKQIKEKLFDLWGERNTLYHTTDKIIATMKDIGALKAIKTGIYVVEKHAVEHQETVELLIKTAMKLDQDGYCLLSDLNEFKCLFPFQYSVDRNTLMNSSAFSISTFDGEITVSIK